MSEQINDELIEISMQILMYAGNGRNLLTKSLKNIEEEDFKKAKENFEKGKKEIKLAHASQTKIIQKEAAGEQIRYSTLFTHAQDTMMTVNSEFILMERLIPIFEKLINKK